jgi:hypothetical protein
LTAVETAAASLTDCAIADADGLLVRAWAEAASAFTELWSALLSFGKSLLALETTAFASSCTLVRADFSPFVPFCTTFVDGTAWIELFRLAIDEQ